MALLKARLTDGTGVDFDDYKIGAGGEKAVFFTQDRQNVVCFFFKSLGDRAERRRRLGKIINDFNPTRGNNGAFWKPYFCWPTGIIEGDSLLPKAFLTRNYIIDPPLGVITPAYAKNFFFTDRTGSLREKSVRWFTGEKARKLLPLEERGNFLKYLQVCTRIARAVRRMHNAGLAHSDLSSKNVLIDPRNGNACIIDIDSLVVPGVAPPTVLGTPGYIAPEVLDDKGQPCIETDCHALGVLIYETLLLRHPLRGKKINSKDSPERDEILSMGSMALFVEHPSDKSNSLESPPAIPLSRLGPYLSGLIIKTFVDGLHNRSKRPTAADWERGLYRTFDLLHPSPGGSDWFVLAPGMPLQCPFTRAKLTQPVPYAKFFNEPKPGTLVDAGRGLTIYHECPLHIWHMVANLTPDENADRKRRGYFLLLRGRWYLVNESGQAMQVVGGRSIASGEYVELTRGLQLRVSTNQNGRVFVFDFLQP
jgi:Protein kinase domain